MSIFSALKNALSSGARELSKDYAKNHDFLDAVTASCALMIYADGTAEESEKQKAMSVLTNHTQLTSVYNDRKVIEQSLLTALSHATTNSGKHELSKSLDKVSSNQDMADDVYLMAMDISTSNSRGEAGDDEKRVLATLAKKLNVDASKFEF